MTDTNKHTYDNLRFDNDGRIDQDLTCLKCGYNLRGLLPDGRCPECGTAVGRSAHGDLLHFCNPDWVSRLASGMNYIWWALVIIILTPIYMLVYTVFEHYRIADLAMEMFLAFWIIGSSVLGIIGLWKITAPDPGKPEVNKGIGFRKSVRLTIAVAVMLWCLLEAATVCAPGSNLIQELFVIAATVGTITAIVIFLIYAQTLAQRGPDLKLAKNTRTVAAGLIIAFLMSFINGVVSPIASSSISGILFFIHALLTLIAWVTPFMFLIFGIWLARLVEQYAKLLKKTADKARQTWAKQSAEPYSTN